MNIPQSPTPPASWFRLHEDDWGLIALVPEENRDDFLHIFGNWKHLGQETRVRRLRSRRYDDQHSTASEHVQSLADSLSTSAESGPSTHFTTARRSAAPFLIPDEKYLIEIRYLDFEELHQLFAELLPPAERVQTSETTLDVGRTCQNCFAFGKTHRLAVYGTQDKGIITSLYLLDGRDADVDRERFAAALQTLGRRHRLILADWQRRLIVDLQDGDRVREYLQEIERGSSRHDWRIQDEKPLNIERPFQAADDSHSRTAVWLIVAMALFFAALGFCATLSFLMTLLVG